MLDSDLRKSEVRLRFTRRFRLERAGQVFGFTSFIMLCSFYRSLRGPVNTIPSQRDLVFWKVKVGLSGSLVLLFLEAKEGASSYSSGLLGSPDFVRPNQ